MPEARLICGEAWGRSSRPSTATTTPSSSAGTCRSPTRWRCCAIPPSAVGCGALTRRSVAPKACEKAEIGPATVTRRAPASAPVTVRPNRPSTSLISSRSAWSVPCLAASSSRLTVSGPVTSAAGSPSRRRVTSVTWICLDSSRSPPGWASATGCRSLPGNGTKEFSGMMCSPDSTLLTDRPWPQVPVSTANYEAFHRAVIQPCAHLLVSARPSFRAVSVRWVLVTLAP